MIDQCVAFFLEETKLTDK